MGSDSGLQWPTAKTLWMSTCARCPKFAGTAEEGFRRRISEQRPCGRVSSVQATLGASIQWASGLFDDRMGWRERWLRYHGLIFLVRSGPLMRDVAAVLGPRPTWHQRPTKRFICRFGHG